MSGYYKFFPPKAMNVSVQEKGETKKKILVAEQDFEKGDQIYTVRIVHVFLDLF